jgi:hypothetical protein
LIIIPQIARMLSLTVPQTLLVAADEVMKLRALFAAVHESGPDPQRKSRGRFCCDAQFFSTMC